ncbi:MAG: histidine kinase [Bacteroidetes bacterium]|nr:histidine kinase [Bacteroidota bacterium]
MNNIVAMFRRLFFCLLVSLPLILTSQVQPLFRGLSTQNGLGSNEVYDVFQDSRGYIWMATAQGVEKYDGRSFKSFSIRQYSSEGASNLLEDRNGRIWFHSFWGQLYFIENDSLHLLHSFNHLIARWSFDQNSQKICFVVDTGIVVVNTADRAHQFLKLSEILGRYFQKNKYINHVQFTSDGNILVLCEGGLLATGKPYGKGWVWTVVRADGAELPFQSIFEYQGKIWAIYNHKFYQITPQGVLFHTGFSATIQSFLAGAVISAVQQTGTDELIINTYNKGAMLLKNMEPHPLWPMPFFTAYSLSRCIRDREGIYWFGTLKKGVMQVTDLTTQRLTGTESALLTSLFAENEKTLLLGYDDGRVLRYDILSGKTAFLVQVKRAIKSIVRAPDGRIFLVADFIYILENDHARLYEQTSDAKDLDFTAQSVPVANTSYSTLAVLDTKYQQQRRQFMQEWKSAGKIKDENTTSPQEHVFLLNLSRAFGLAVNRQEPAVYTSATDGLFRLTPAGKTRILWQGRDIYSKSMVMNGNVLYCATDHGLFIIQGEKVTKTITQKDGLQDNRIYKVKYQQDMLLLLSQKGLDVYDPDNGQVWSFGEHNGIAGQEIMDMCLAQGRIYLGTSQGLVSFALTNTGMDEVAPKMYINRLVAGSRNFLPLSQIIQLEPSENTVRIAFNGLHFKSGSNLRYEYRLLGYADTAWLIRQGMEPELVYNHLPPGKYIFQVRARSYSGLLSHTATCTFYISSPWYKTWWFYALVVVLALGSVWLYNRITIRRKQAAGEVLLEREKLDKELQVSQLQALKMQMNPHFMFNALNSIQEFILTNEKRLANQYLGKFSDLMRMTLDMSQEEKVLLADEIKLLNLYLDLEKLRFGGDLQTEIVLDESINPEEIYIPGMLIQPYVENALKHGLLHRKGNKKLSLRFAGKNNERVLSCVVEDNGIGRERSSQIREIRNKSHRSFATGATQRRLDLLNAGRKNAIAVDIQDLKEASGEAAGTRVVMEIPYS